MRVHGEMKTISALQFTNAALHTKLIQDLQNVKNIKSCRDGMPKKHANKVGIMHEIKGQHIDKAPSLHLFHSQVRQCMGVSLKHTVSSQSLLAGHGCSLVLGPLPSPS